MPVMVPFVAKWGAMALETGRRWANGGSWCRSCRSGEKAEGQDVRTAMTARVKRSVT